MSSLSRGLSRYLLIALMAVGMAGAALGLLLAGKAAVLMTLVVIAGVIALSLVRDLEYVSFLVLAATMPIRLNMRLTEPAAYERAHSAMGFLIGITDCVIVVLLIAWARRILFFDQPIRWLPKITIPMGLLLVWVVYAGLRAEDDLFSGGWMVLRYLECCALMLYLVNNIRPIHDYVAHALTTSGMLLFESTLGLGQGITGGFNFGMKSLARPSSARSNTAVRALPARLRRRTHLPRPWPVLCCNRSACCSRAIEFRRSRSAASSFLPDSPSSRLNRVVFGCRARSFSAT